MQTMQTRQSVLQIGSFVILPLCMLWMAGCTKSGDTANNPSDSATSTASNGPTGAPGQPPGPPGGPMGGPPMGGQGRMMGGPGGPMGGPGGMMGGPGGPRGGPGGPMGGPVAANASGSEIYQAKCRCHGPDGKGGGAPALNQTSGRSD